MANIPVFTILDAMIACGVDNTSMFDGKTPARRISDDIFDNDYITCMDKTMEELKKLREERE